ncbi:MAG: hypothetical protein ABJA64_01495 [Candidatus Saccharibacteria bacterium]
MYSGTTIRTKSGRLMGVHQKIDRVALRHIKKHVPKTLHFPSTRDILHFEGANGPDGIKRKSPGRDEPWHFIDPYHEGDHEFFDMIEDHVHNLAVALRANNQERAAFEAAWMAHAITDGLTPAHHYPLEEKLEELRGEGMVTRTTKKQKVVMPGNNRRHQLRNNWEFWGTKGVMTTHLGFEFGVSTTIATLRFDDAYPSESEYELVRNKGFERVFREMLQEIAAMNMYEEFTKLGWTRRLAQETKNTLMPLIIKAVILGWYEAIIKAESET